MNNLPQKNHSSRRSRDTVVAYLLELRGLQPGRPPADALEDLQQANYYRARAGLEAEPGRERGN